MHIITPCDPAITPPRYWRRRLGLVVRYSHSGCYRFCYSSRGKPGGATPSLLLLHGFSATKDMWLPVVKVANRHTYTWKCDGVHSRGLPQKHFFKMSEKKE